MSLVNEINSNLKKGEVVEYSEIAAELAKLKEQYGSVVPDCSSRESYEFSKLAANTCKGIRLNLEVIRKEKKKPYLDYGKLIDSKAKEIVAALSAIELPHKEAYQAKDNERKATLEGRKQTILDLNRSFDSYQYKSESEIELRISEVQDLDISYESFGRLANDVVAAQSTAIDQLYRAHAEAVNRRVEAEKVEAEREELERLRKNEERRKKEKEEEDQKAIIEQNRIDLENQQKAADIQAKESAAKEAELEIKLAKEAEEQAKENERNAKLQAEEQAKQSKIDAEVAKKEAAEQVIQAAETARLAEVERQRQQKEQEEQEAADREAKTSHRRKINNQAKSAFIAAGLEPKQAELAVKAIASKLIPPVTISY